MNKIPDRSELISLFAYDKDTGVFTAAISKGSRKQGDVCGSLRPDGYLSICISGKAYFAHRLAWVFVHGHIGESVIDHANGVRSDNRISNLRLTDARGNNQNIRSARTDSKLGFLGVSKPNPNCKKPYVARIRNNGELKNIGFFETPEAAHEAYLIEKRLTHQFCTI